MFAFAGVVVKTGVIIMSTITIKPLNELSLTELFDAYGRVIWAQSQCEVGFGKQFEIHANAIDAIKAEIERRESKQRHGAMFVQKTINREEDGEILYA